jgi:hypothetical protein
MLIELAVAADEFLGPVERIDEPEQPVMGRDAAGSCLLLGDHRDLRRQLAQVAQDHRLGALVGLGHRRRIFLAAHREIGAVDGHRGGACFACDRDDPLSNSASFMLLLFLHIQRNIANYVV